MSELTWAEAEVAIACEREKQNEENPGDSEYGVACYISALRTYAFLMEEGHSGTSLAITKRILDRLLDGKPLTPIEDREDMWVESTYCDDFRLFVCKRMHSLFKTVHPDGTVEYDDVQRIRVCDPDNPTVCYTNGFISKIINKMYPITMPYTGDDHYLVYCTEFLTDEKNGDFDTIHVISVRDPKDIVHPINRYFKESGNSFEEIGLDEFLKRKEMARALTEKLNKNAGGNENDGGNEDEQVS